VCEGGSTNAFKLAEGEAGMMVSSGRAIPSKKANLPGWMIAITGTMLLRGTLDNRNETKHYRSMARTTSLCPSLKRLSKAK
jgi:hypothetical protein